MIVLDNLVLFSDLLGFFILICSIIGLVYGPLIILMFGRMD